MRHNVLRITDQEPRIAGLVTPLPLSQCGISEKGQFERNECIAISEIPH